jgi:hypothetical protein
MDGLWVVVVKMAGHSGVTRHFHDYPTLSRCNDL